MREEGEGVVLKFKLALFALLYDKRTNLLAFPQCIQSPPFVLKLLLPLLPNCLGVSHVPFVPCFGQHYCTLSRSPLRLGQQVGLQGHGSHIPICSG